MSNIPYFEKNDTNSFWEEFQKLISNRDKRYIKTFSANATSLQNIKFPEIDIEKIILYLFPSESGGIDKRIVFENCIFEKEVNLEITKSIRDVKLVKCIFNQNVLVSIRPLKKLFIDQCTFNHGIEFKEMIVESNDKRFILRNSKVKGILKIINCHIEYGHFYNLNLKNATIEISESILTGLKFNNIQWGKKFNCDRDTCRQIKVIMEQDKNYIDAHRFHGMELNEYRKELFENSRLKENFWEKILFGFNWIVSSFSTSWIRPLVLLIIFSLLIYGWICYNHLIQKPCSINGFFEFFNPFSRTATSEYKNIYWLWFIHKVISAFLLYHFIVALKKSSRF